jgi:hypothetical protein
MKKLRNTIGAVAVLAVGIKGAQASADQSQAPLAVQKGVYYSLTSEAAKALEINLGRMIEEAQLNNNQQLAFQIQEDGELDLSIYESGVFVRLRCRHRKTGC